MINISGLILWFCLVVGVKARAQQFMSKADRQPYSLSLTAKLHSTGHFPYSGIYLNDHVNGEINVTYKNKQFGAFVSKTVDFTDRHSAINYATTGLFRSFRLTKSLKVTPYVGYFLRQSYSFMDDASDLWACVVVTLAVSRSVTIENTVLAGNLVRHQPNVSVANRLNAMFRVGTFKVDAYAWYVHSSGSPLHFVSSSLAITSPDWVITPAVSTRVQVAMLQQMTREKPEGTMRRGILVSLIVPIELSTRKKSSTKS